MYIKNRVFSIAWKFAICFVATFGVLMQIGILGDGPLNPVLLNYFTIISNILVAFYFLVDAVWLLNHPTKARLGREWNVDFKHVVLMCILVTGIIANTLLRGNFDQMAGTVALSMTLLHVFSPIMVALDWLLFERKGQMKAGEPFIWLIFPLLYLVYLVVAVEGFHCDFNMYETASCYPYPFIDLDALGIQQFAQNVIIVGLVFLLLGYVIFAIDRILKKIGNHKNEQTEKADTAVAANATSANAVASTIGSATVTTGAADETAATDTPTETAAETAAKTANAADTSENAASE